MSVWCILSGGGIEQREGTYAPRGANSAKASEKSRRGTAWGPFREDGSHPASPWQRTEESAWPFTPPTFTHLCTYLLCLILFCICNGLWVLGVLVYILSCTSSYISTSYMALYGIFPWNSIYIDVYLFICTYVWRCTSASMTPVRTYACRNTFTYTLCKCRAIQICIRALI